MHTSIPFQVGPPFCFATKCLDSQSLLEAVAQAEGWAAGWHAWLLPVGFAVLLCRLRLVRRGITGAVGVDGRCVGSVDCGGCVERMVDVQVAMDGGFPRTGIFA